jgi:hypothetical protein
VLSTYGARTVKSMSRALRYVVFIALTIAVVSQMPSSSHNVAPGPFPQRTVFTEIALRSGSSISHVERTSVIEYVCRPVTITPGKTRSVCQDVTFTSSSSKLVKFCTNAVVSGRKVSRCQTHRLAPTTKPIPAPSTPKPTPSPTFTTSPAFPEAPAGTFKFSDLDKNGLPVRFEVCKVLTWSVSGSEQEVALTREAFTLLEAATGFTLKEVSYDGFRPLVDPLPSSPTSRTGIVVRWSSEAEIIDLAGSVAGVTQSLWWSLGEKSWRSFSAVSLESTGEPLTRAGGNSAWAVLLHELGHAVGLAHVDDLNQIMFPTTWTGTSDRYQQGDVAGLARIGRGNTRCN